MILRRFRQKHTPPQPLLFGVCTSDHQCEAYDPRWTDVRDVWEEVKLLTKRGRATDFWNRYAEDIQLAQSLGCKAFRLSIAWSRVEPAAGQFSDEALDHYCQLIGTIRAAGMEPVLTLLHFAWPVHVEERGGMIDDEFPIWFARYASKVAERVGADVRYWITFNEPNVLPFGYIKPWWKSDYAFPPGLPHDATMQDQIDAVGRLIRNLFLAHARARKIIQAANPDALVGANPGLLGLPGWLQDLLDRIVARTRDEGKFMRQEQALSESALLEHGRVDVVMAMLSVTPARQEQIDFSEIYYFAGQMLLVKQDSSVRQRDDLSGKKVAVIKGSTAENTLSWLIPGALPLIFHDYPTAIAALQSGQSHALLADDTMLRGIMQLHPRQYRLVGDKLTKEPYAAAVAKGNPQLLNVVNGAVRRFKASGEWQASLARQSPGEPIPPPPQLNYHATISDVNKGPFVKAIVDRQPRDRQPPLARPGTLLRRIQDRGYIVVAVKQDAPGFGYRDPQTGEWSGLEVDLARALARFIFGDDNKVVFRPTSTEQRIPLLRTIVRFLDPLLKLYSILASSLTTNWWYLGLSGKLTESLCPRECVGQLDFVGLDYYWGISSLQPHRVLHLMDALAGGDYEHAPVWPGALYDMVKSHSRMFPNKPIVVVENGSVESADGISRADYLRLHIAEIKRARREGVNVAAYLCWSITSNRELGLEFTPSSDFGLYHIELDTDPELKRLPTPAAVAYREIIASSGA